MTEYYWHFVRVDEDGVPRLGYGDGREVKVGETLKVEGERAYDLARAGKDVELKPRKVTIHALSLVTAGTMVLTLVLLVSFIVYYFANWKALADVWPVR